MSQSLVDILSKPLSNLKVLGNTRTITGSFSISSQVISTLPTGHGVLVGDKASFSVVTVATLSDQGVVGVMDVTSLEAGTFLVRIDKAESSFSDLASFRTEFPSGNVISFQSGILSGAYGTIKNSSLLGGFSAYDGGDYGDPGYWWIILDGSTLQGFPAINTYPTWTDISPSISVYTGVSGTSNYEGLVTASGATSITLDGSIPNASFDDIVVEKHSRIVGRLVSQEIDSQRLKINGLSIPEPLPTLPFDTAISSFKFLWKGKDELNNVISSENPHLPEINPTDPFNVGVDINIIEILNHPINKEIGVLLYQDLTNSNFYLKAFKYVYETGFDNTYTPYLISGADSSDIKAVFTTYIDRATQQPLEPHIFIVGGKDTPGTSIYCGVVSINTTTLDISDTGLFAWGDTGQTSTNSFTSLIKISDLSPVYDQFSIPPKKIAVAFNTENFIGIDFDISTQTFSVSNETIDNTLVNYSYDYYNPDNSGSIFVVGDNFIRDAGGLTSYPISKNNISLIKKTYAGASNSSITLFKADNYKGFGSETFCLDSNNIADNLKLKSNLSYQVIPIQNDFSNKTVGKGFELGKDKLLIYQAFGYYLLFNKHSGDLLYVGRVGNSFPTVSKADSLITSINDSTIIRWDGSQWRSVKFLTDGPYLAYKKVANNAVIANDKTKIQTDFSLETGKTYYFSYSVSIRGITPVINTEPVFASKKLGVAITSNTFYVDFDFKSPGAFDIFTNLERGVTPIIAGLGDGNILFQQSGVLQQDSGLKFINNNLGISTSAPEHSIQTAGALATGVLFASISTSGTINDLPGGDSNGIYFPLTGGAVLTGIVNSFSTTLGTRLVLLFNTSNDYTLTIKHQDAGSSGLNRFTTPSGGDYVIPPRGSVLAYETEGGWFIVEKPVSSPIESSPSGSVGIPLGYKDKYNINPTGATTLNLSLFIPGCTYVFRIKQGATPYTVAFSSTPTIKWKGGTPYVATNSANAIDIVSIYYDGTDLLGTFGDDYS